MYFHDLPNVDANFALAAGDGKNFAKKMEGILSAVLNDDAVKQMDPKLVKKLQDGISECRAHSDKMEERWRNRTNPTFLSKDRR